MIHHAELRSHAGPLNEFRRRPESGTAAASVGRPEREIDMTWHVLEQLGVLVKEPFDDIAAEVPCASSLADLAVVKFDASELARRERLGMGPIRSSLRMCVLDEICFRGVTRIDTLASRVGSRPEAIRRSTLKPLAEIGVIELASDRVEVLEPWRPVAETITTIELKLDDWRGALSQARSQARSADHCWVVLRDRRASTLDAMRVEFAAHGIGVAILSDACELRVEVKPRKQSPVRWLRGITIELAWQLISEQPATT